MEPRAAVDQALVPLVAALAPWGVDEAHWLPDRGGMPVVWVRVPTAAQRVALQAQPWVSAQLEVTLARLGVPHEVIRRTTLEVTSVEEEARLFEG